MKNTQALTSLLSKILPLVLQHQSVEDAEIVASAIFCLGCHSIIKANQKNDSQTQYKELTSFSDDAIVTIADTLLMDGYSPEEVDIFLDKVSKILVDILPRQATL